MTDYTWPDDLGPFAQTFFLQPHTGRSQSPFTRQQKIYGLSAPLWICRMSFRGGYDGRTGISAYGPRLDAFLAKLKGGQNRVTIADYRRRQMRAWGWQHDISNSAVLIGATTMTLTGFAPYARAVLAGDYVGGDGRPHIITDDANANASGNATVSFEPPLSAAIGEGEAVFGEDATGIFRLSSDDAGDNGTEVGQLSIIQLEFIEDI